MGDPKVIFFITEAYICTFKENEYHTLHTEKLCLGKHLEMILVTIDNEIHTAIFHLLHSICSCGLVVRIAGFYPGEPGSIPGLGMLFWLVFTFYQTLRPFFGLG